MRFHPTKGDKKARASNGPGFSFGVKRETGDKVAGKLVGDGYIFPEYMITLSKKELLDLQFIDARARLIDLAAFLDRLDRHHGEGGARLDYFRRAIPLLLEDRPDRAKAVLEVFSDVSVGLTETAPFQGATGAPVV